jgi:CRISPR-associated protein Cmr4
MTMQQRILYIFTRTSMHVGAGASVGAIDQPIQRERHTAFPIIPASSLKGSFADQWEANLKQGEKRFLRVTTKKEGDKEVVAEALESAWLFGSNNEKAAFTGAVQFGEARLLAFPIRSAKGSFAWITSPLILRRAARDGVVPTADLPSAEPADDKALFPKTGPLALGAQLVLEEYTFTYAGEPPPGLSNAFEKLLSNDPVWKEVSSRLVILSDGMMSFFAQNACEVAQHVRISDETGTAEAGALFNQENVPSETFFYAVINATESRLKLNGYADKKAKDALDAFGKKLNEMKVFQFGGDASTGLGYCTVKLTN